MANPDSITGHFLRAAAAAPAAAAPRGATKRRRRSRCVGATLHNLKDVDVRLPLGRLVGRHRRVGLGQVHARARRAAREPAAPGRRGARPQARRAAHHRLPKAHQGLGSASTRVLEVDQTPIGKTPRSCPATYVGFLDNIRKLFADTQEARIRGYTASRFSFNTAGGRCDGVRRPGREDASR